MRAARSHRAVVMMWRDKVENAFSTSLDAAVEATVSTTEHRQSITLQAHQATMPSDRS